VRLSKLGHQQLNAAEKRLETLLDDGSTAPLAQPASDE
jgi:exonuclease VII small subunit